jgi:hypothetical protein
VGGPPHRRPPCLTSSHVTRPRSWRCCGRGASSNGWTSILPRPHLAAALGVAGPRREAPWSCRSGPSRTHGFTPNAGPPGIRSGWPPPWPANTDGSDMTDRPTLKCASENEAVKLEDRDEKTCIEQWVAARGLHR